LVNGAEAIGGDGRIVIEAEDFSVGIGGERQVRISVRDDGCGMNEVEVKQVFEPFFTTKKGGTGLGLATVYRIVQSHAGRIMVHSVRGEGTTVTLYLPS